MFEEKDSARFLVINFLSCFIISIILGIAVHFQGQEVSLVFTVKMAIVYFIYCLVFSRILKFGDRIDEEAPIFTVLSIIFVPFMLPLLIVLALSNFIDNRLK